MDGSSDNELILLRATVRKLRAERKVMHEMLSDVGIPNDVLGDGVRTCLIGRIAIAIAMPPVDNSIECHCPSFGHRVDCPNWK